MRDLNPEISFQTTLKEQLYNILQCEALMDIRKTLNSSNMDFQLRTDAIANGMKVTLSTMPELYNTCFSIKENLGMADDVDFYITGDSTVNATSYLSEEEYEPHIVTINSALFNLMNENELKFIIGHELGHLINKDSIVHRQYAFVYPDEEDGGPKYLRNRIEQYSQLAEYGADRYGYMACMDLAACISAFYKMSSGIDLQNVGVSIDALLEENENNMGYIFENLVSHNGTHPHNPCRVYALQMYALCKTQKKLDEEMGKLFDLLPGKSLSKAQYYFIKVCVLAACQMVGGKNKLSKMEMECLYELVAEKFDFPSKKIKEFLRDDDNSLINDIYEIKEDNPDLFEEIVKFLLEVAMADDVITTEEINFIVDFGISNLKMEIEDVYDIIAQEVRTNYNCCAAGL